jgi:hypothetical protein
MESIPVWLLVVLIVAAVAAGLYVGHRAGELGPGDRNAPKKSIGGRARELATRGVVSLWKWNRGRKKQQKKDDERR